MVRLGEGGREFLEADGGDGFVAARVAAQRGDFHAKGCEQLQQLGGDSAEAEDDEVLTAERS